MAITFDSGEVSWKTAASRSLTITWYRVSIGFDFIGIYINPTTIQSRPYKMIITYEEQFLALALLGSICCCLVSEGADIKIND
jgi:hypothetical protein